MPQRLTPLSPDGSELTIEALRQIAPSCITEVKDPQSGAIRQVVDFDVLRTLLGDQSVEAGTEMYSFIWPGKQAARREAATPITDTLRPVLEDSVDWDSTENLYIEGDNLSVLKLLQRSYVGKIKMIYIDPPYNTGNDFIYNDDYTIDRDTWARQSGERDEEGNQYRKNPDTNGRFHSDWCSMIYSRLLLSRSLLTDDGVIFISIDDNEVHNLRKICDEVFGASNFVAQITTISNLKGHSDQKFFAKANEFLLVYAKSIDIAHISGFEISSEEIENEYDEVDEIGYYKLIGLRKTGNAWRREDRPRMFYPILLKDDLFSTVSKCEHKQIYDAETASFNDQLVNELTRKYSSLGYEVFWPISVENGALGRWRWGRSTFLEEKEYNVELNSNRTVCSKMRATIEDGSIRMKSAKTIWYKPEYETGSSGKLLKRMFNGKSLFDNPKSLVYITDIVRIATEPDSIVLDFFSGSGTTAHAVMQLNAEDGGHRKFICVQFDEDTPEGSEARKAGYNTIPDIAKERIRRAATKIKEENSLTTNSLDTGFRVFRLDSSNFTDVKRTPASYEQTELDQYQTNIKKDRSGQDLLYGAMLSWGLSLSLPQAVTVVDGCEIYNVDEGALVACFDKAIPTTVIEAIADMDPLRVLLSDSSFASDKEKINTFELLKQRLNWDDREALDKVRVL